MNVLKLVLAAIVALVTAAGAALADGPIVLPDTAPLPGGILVTITGINLGDGTDITNVTLCGVSAAIQGGQSATQVVVSAGATDAAGIGDVAVYSTSVGATVLSNAFCYRIQADIPTNDLTLWLRSDVGVLVEDGGVSKWFDQSGLDWHAFQTNAVARPTLSGDNVFTNLPAVQFDGIDDYLARDDGIGIYNSTTGFTMYLVFRYPVDPVNNVGLFSLASSAFSDWTSADGMGFYQKNDVFQGRARRVEWLQGISYDGSNPGPDALGLSTNTSPELIPTGEALYFAATKDGTTARLIFNKEVIEEDSYDLPGDLDNPTLNTAGYVVGARAGQGEIGWCGRLDICEIIIFNRLLNTNEMVQMDEYMGLSRQTDLGLAILGTNGAVIAPDETPNATKGSKFPHVRIGSTHTHMFSITNQSVSTVTLEEAVLTDDTHFSFTGVPATLAAGAASNFTVTYTPTSIGDHATTLIVTNSSSISNLTLHLAGSNFDIAPDKGPYAGGNTSTVTNGTFGAITNVLVGGAPATIVDSGENWFSIVMPFLDAAGAVDIVVQTDSYDITLIGAYMYNPAGEITTVLPDSGLWTGGYEVLISGTNFGADSDITNVTLCGVAVTNIAGQSVTQVVVWAGSASSAGIGDVRVFSTSYGETVKPNAFTYTVAGLQILGTNGAVIAYNEQPSADKGTIFPATLPGMECIHTLGLTNNGTAELVIDGIGLVDPANMFDLVSLSGPLAPGATGHVAVAFRPTSAGTFAATLDLSHNAPPIGLSKVNFSGTSFKYDQAITFNAIPNKNVNDTVSLEATASSGLTVSFTNTPGSPVIWQDAKTIIFSSTGTVGIIASQPGDDNWNPAQSVTNTFNVIEDDPPEPSDLAVLGDYTGDGQSDMPVYDALTGNWYIRFANEPNLKSQISNLRSITPTAQFGGPGYVPVPGDYTGDGVNDPAVYGTANGLWYISTLAGEIIVNGEQWGGPGFIPVAGDYSGNGIYDIAVYEQATGNWYIRFANEQNLKSQISHFQPEADQPVAEKSIEPVAQFGGLTMLPVSGDYDGNGKYDLAVYEQATGNWYIHEVNEARSSKVKGQRDGTFQPEADRPSAFSLQPSAFSFSRQFGGPGFAQVSGDYDGDGKHDLAVYHQTSGLWYVMGVDGRLIAWAEQWGGPGFAPVSGDYTGDGKSDLAVYDVATGKWYIRTMAGGLVLWAEQWGGPGLTPVLGADVAAHPEGLAPVYRLYSYGHQLATLEHLLTMSGYEAEYLLSTPYWVDEGVAWYALASGKGDAFPLYRLYNETIKAHYYTLDASHYETLAGQGWTGEGVSMYVWATAAGGRMPVYQFYNAATGLHLFTADKNEKNTLIGDFSYGYEYQGIAFYVYGQEAWRQ